MTDKLGITLKTDKEIKAEDKKVKEQIKKETKKPTKEQQEMLKNIFKKMNDITQRMPKDQKETKKEVKKNDKEPLKLLKENWIIDKPKILGLFKNPFAEARPVTAEELEERSPLLFYLDEERNILVYENARPGIIRPKDAEGKEKGSSNMIESRKLHTLKYGEFQKPIKCYVQSEKEYFSYPLEPMLDAEAITRAINILQANYKELDEKLNSMGNLSWNQVKTWLFLIGGVLALILGTIWIGNMFGVWETLGWTGIQAAATTTNQTINATIQTTTVP